MKTLSTEEFIEESINKHGQRYNYKFVVYIASKRKVKIICPIHGIFEQTPNSHLKGSGCPECSILSVKSSLTKDIDLFVIQAKNIHNNQYDYSKVKYYNTHTKVDIVCTKHGVFEQTPNSHLRGRGCRECHLTKIRNNDTEYGANFLMYKQCVDKFTKRSYRRYKNIINPFVYKRSRKGYHLDHKYSIYEGFRNGIPAYVIGSHHNLQIIKYIDNLTKMTECSITIDELYKLIKKEQLW